MQIFQVDAFATEPFRGNPAAVCLLERGPSGQGPSDQWLQSVAAEMNLAETAFIDNGQGDDFGLRWFTPTVEVDLCGHATLASAHVLWELGDQRPRLAFRTRSGRLTAERVAGAIRLDFPSDPVTVVEPPPGLVTAVGAEVVAFGQGRSFYLAEVADAATVGDLVPDIAAIKALMGAVIVTAPGDGDHDGEYDFVSRFFAPAFGIDEDPVTGAAHCCLAPYWQARLGRDQLVGYQASARGGVVGMAVARDRVLLSGQAVTVLRGELLA